MLAGTLAFAIGIICLLSFVNLPPVWGILFIFPVIIFVRIHRLFKLVFMFFIGFYCAWFYAYTYINKTLPEELENSDILIKGIVMDFPERYDDHVRFKLKLIDIDNTKGVSWSSSPVIRLSWYKPAQLVKPGEIWQLKVKLKRPYGFMNPGGFDYEYWLMRQQINALGYVKESSHNHQIENSSSYFLQQIRYAVAEKLKQVAPERLYGLVLALSLGERSALSSKQKNILTRTGTAHLIAISGLHLSLVAGIIFLIARFIWSRFYFLTEKLPASVFASVISFLAVFFYAALAGFSLPTQRALIMIGVLMYAIFSGRQIVFSSVIAISVFIILLFDPFSIIAADFWLSFMAVIFIIYTLSFRINRTRKLTKWIYLQCYLSLALCPLLILWFKQIPVYSVLANMIAIPLIGFVVVPLTLVAMIMLFMLPSISDFIYNLILFISNMNWNYLEFLSQQQFGVIPVTGPNVFTIVLAIIGALILLMPRGIPARWLGVVWFLPLIFPIIKKPHDSEFDLTLLDVGQGLSAVIQTKEHTLVYDTGARFSERFNIGDAVLVPYLRNNGVDKISMLIISHGDNDHIGGAKSVLSHFETEQILTSVPEKLPLHESQYCSIGQTWEWDDVRFEILHPDLNNSLSGNNDSCVLKVTGITGSVLLTGDIEKEAEKALLMRSPEKIDANVLIVPHHGSKTSSTNHFIDAVSPEYAFFPAGYRNRFGFPKQDILFRYENRGIDTRVSYQTGALSVKFRKNGLQLHEFRQDNHHFWHYQDSVIPGSN